MTVTFAIVEKDGRTPSENPKLDEVIVDQGNF